MQCPHCNAGIPDFIIPTFNNREQRCPNCMRFAPPSEEERKEIREFVMKAERRMKRQRAKRLAKEERNRINIPESMRYMETGVEEGIYEMMVGPPEPNAIVKLGNAVKDKAVVIGDAVTDFSLIAKFTQLANKLELIDMRRNNNEHHSQEQKDLPRPW